MQLIKKPPIKRPRALEPGGSRKVKAAIDLMVWNRDKRDQAAKKAGLQPVSLRVALAKPHVLQYYREQLQVLRDSEVSRSYHRIAAIRDHGYGQPALNAAKWFIGDDDVAAQGRTSGAPGVTIIIEGDANARQVSATPESVTISTPAMPLLRDDTPHPFDLEDPPDAAPGGKNGPKRGRW